MVFIFNRVFTWKDFEVVRRSRVTRVFATFRAARDVIIDCTNVEADAYPSAVAVILGPAAAPAGFPHPPLMLHKYYSGAATGWLEEMRQASVSVRVKIYDRRALASVPSSGRSGVCVVDFDLRWRGDGPERSSTRRK